MKNFVASGDSVDYTVAGTAIVSGEPRLVGAFFGIAKNSGLVGELVPMQVTGIVTIAKNATQALTFGQAVYWDDTNKNVTTTVGSNKLIGYATQAALAADTTAEIRLVV